MKRRLLSLTLVCALVMSGCAGALSEAAQPQFASTKAFIQMLGEEGLSWSFAGESEGYESVQLDFQSENGEYTYTIGCYFRDDGWCYMRGYEVYHYVMMMSACILVNQLNIDYNGVYFYVDEDDQAVTVAIDALLPDDASAAAAVSRALLVKICYGFENGRYDLELNQP